MSRTPIAPSQTAPASPSRRKLLAAGIGLTAAAAFGPWSVRATGLRRQGELFAFTAPDREDIVFALALDAPSVGTKDDQVAVRLHAGDDVWNFRQFVRGTLTLPWAMPTGCSQVWFRALDWTTRLDISSQWLFPPNDCRFQGSMYGRRSSMLMAPVRASATLSSRVSLRTIRGF